MEEWEQRIGVPSLCVLQLQLLCDPQVNHPERMWPFLSCIPLNLLVFNLAVLFQQVHHIVNDALKRYSEDRIGMVDYALESGGKKTTTTTYKQVSISHIKKLELFWSVSPISLNIWGAYYLLCVCLCTYTYIYILRTIITNSTKLKQTMKREK